MEGSVKDRRCHCLSRWSRRPRSGCRQSARANNVDDHLELADLALEQLPQGTPAATLCTFPADRQWARAILQAFKRLRALPASG
jgi:hypothetical protein